MLKVNLNRILFVCFTLLIYILWIPKHYTMATMPDGLNFLRYQHRQPDVIISFPKKIFRYKSKDKHSIAAKEKKYYNYKNYGKNLTHLRPTRAHPYQKKKYDASKDDETNYSEFLQEMKPTSTYRWHEENFIEPIEQTRANMYYVEEDNETEYDYDSDLESETDTEELSLNEVNYFRAYAGSNGNPRLRTNAVFPGTIWCGPGNKAPTDDTVGFFFKTDTCCRDHDRCFDTIPPKTHKYSLYNRGMFTRSHCECDLDFYMCLKKANTFVSYKVGFAYFNILRPQCFRREYPVVKCVEWYSNRCMTYLLDESRMEAYQWFDNRIF